MEKLSEKAIKAIRAGVARAKEIPQGFDMDLWCFLKTDVPCGTAGCLAFEIAVANGVDPKTLILSSSFISSSARTITPEEYVIDLVGEDFDLYTLFRTGYWPSDLHDRYHNAAEYSLERALVLEEAVERWIAGNGKFLE